MLEILKVVVMGVVEGLTEFIPVSSTGHLILVGRWISFENPTFAVAIQLGAILAVLVLYRSFFKWRNMPNMIIATIPALGMGFLLHSVIKSMFSPNVVIVGLFVGGVIMIIVEKVIKPKASVHSMESITPKQALAVGLCQCFSLWPGISRSGATIVGGLLAGLEYKAATEFSFVVAVPVMIAATGYDLFKNFSALSTHDLGLIAIGFAVSFGVALVSMLTFIKWLRRLKLTPFGIYRIVLALILLAGVAQLVEH